MIRLTKITCFHILKLFHFLYFARPPSLTLSDEKWKQCRISEKPFADQINAMIIEPLVAAYCVAWIRVWTCIQLERKYTPCSAHTHRKKSGRIEADYEPEAENGTKWSAIIWLRIRHTKEKTKYAWAAVCVYVCVRASLYELQTKRHKSVRSL